MKDMGKPERPSTSPPEGGRQGSPNAGRSPPGDPVSLSLSFEDFFEVEEAGLFGALCLLTGDRQEAEDLKQEAFLKVWERWNLIQSLANPTGYLYRTAMNAFRMRRRRAKVAARRLFGRPAPSDDLSAAEARHEVDRGLNDLTPRQRAAVVLTELLQFSSSEAAEALGVKPATVRKLASQGREVLRRTIGRRDE
jgi:RNA polymerase sigma-70 factor, ECF subfamily